MKIESDSDAQANGCLLISDFNLANLKALLAKDRSLPRIQGRLAPYGQVLEVLLKRDPALWTADLSSLLLWTRPHAIISNFKKLLQMEGEVRLDDLLAEVETFAGAVKQAPAHIKHIFVTSWILPREEARLGLMQLKLGGAATALMRMNLHLVECLSTDPRIVVLDVADWAARCGGRIADAKSWYMAKTPYPVELFQVAVQELKAALGALTGRSRKLLVVDLDNTLWGGVIGDTGWERIRLGGHDPVGEAFRDFQTALKQLNRRGILLGIVSKNDEALALEPFRRHPEMVLKLEDFAAWRINWNDKAQNILDLTAELNLGLDSVVFIDDSPVERARVREAIPEVLVPEWPLNPMQYREALAEMRCFDVAAVTDEDRQRGLMYHAERKRKEARSTAGNLEAWLQTLEMKVTVETLNEANLERAAQLLNKTNQMNLRTRRLSRETFWRWGHEAGNTVLLFRVQDKFGDYGLVGIGSVSVGPEPEKLAAVADFVLSCRVMGRRVEEALLHVLSRRARVMGATRLRAEYVDTDRNKPCRAFFESSGLKPDGDHTVFTWDLSKVYAKPDAVVLDADAAARAWFTEAEPCVAG